MAANKKLRLALVAVAVAAEPGAEPTMACQIPMEEMKAWADQIVKDYNKNSQGKVFSPDCCNELARNLGCGCVLRDLVLAAKIDIQEPFCVDGSGCRRHTVARPSRGQCDEQYIQLNLSQKLLLPALLDKMEWHLPHPNQDPDPSNNITPMTYTTPLAPPTSGGKIK